ARALAVATGARDADEPDPREVLALRFYITSATLGALVAAIALAVLAGWWFEIPSLTRVFPGFASMKANTAVALLLTALALLLYRRRGPSPRTSRVVRYAVGASSLVALLTLIEHVTGFGLGIDQLLVLDPDSGPTAPGRMAATTA